MAKKHTPPAGQSFELGEFYAAYAFWLERGAPNGRPFARQYGLCSALSTFCDLAGLEPDDCDDISHNLDREMISQFCAEGLSMTCPFNDEANPYWQEADKPTNPARRAWVMARRNP